MKKILLYILLVSLLSAETSAFMAGNLDSDNPYGLTNDEKYIWKNKEEIKKLNKIVKEQKALILKQSKEINRIKIQILNTKLSLDSLSQQVDGIKTLLNSLDNFKMQISNLKQELNSIGVSLFSLKDEFSVFKKSMSENLENLKSIVNKNKMVNDGNTKTVIALVENLANKMDNFQLEIDSLNKKFTKKFDFRNLPKMEILNKGINYFKSGNFSKAQKMFNYLYSVKFRPATNLFYLGEIQYKQGNYKGALSYYKNSIQTYSKITSFGDELLYHTGYSLEKIGQKEAAKKSYLKLINDYPKSMFVKYARKRLQNLENKQ